MRHTVVYWEDEECRDIGEPTVSDSHLDFHKAIARAKELVDKCYGVVAEVLTEEEVPKLVYCYEGAK